MIKIKEIEANETIPLRSKILRPGMDISTCYYPHDEDESSFHLGAFIEGELICIVSFYNESHPNLEANHQYRFRGMATLEEYRGKGIASELLKYSFDKLEKEKTDLVWCNARVKALGLYEKLGMQIASDEFEIEGIGPHYLMKKSFN